MSGSAQTLLSHHPYIKLIANNGWIQEADFVILKARQAQTPFVGIASGDKGTERCFALWKEKICPYVNEYYNIAKKIPLNVKIVRALGDLAQHPSSSSAIECRKFLESLPEDIYEKLISCHKDFLQKNKISLTRYVPEQKITNPKHVLKDKYQGLLFSQHSMFLRKSLQSQFKSLG